MTPRTSRIVSLAVALVATATLWARQSTPTPQMTPEVRAALDRISAESMKGHLSFIASDLLGGRNTPSPGLDLAAEYIAAQFRRAGLEPVGDDGYFQTAPWIFAERDPNKFSFVLTVGSQTLPVSASQVSFTFAQELTLPPTSVVKVDFNNKDAQAALTAADVEGKVVVTELPPAAAGRGQAGQPNPQAEFLARLAPLNPVLIVSIDRANAGGTFAGAGRLINPEQAPAGGGAAGAGRAAGAAPGRGGAPSASIPVLRLESADAIKACDALPNGATSARIAVNAPAPEERPIKLRNVVGVLRGSDPVLRDSYVLVTAHYDHLGMALTGDGDRISNGANDDGSGTVSVIEIGAALAKLESRPKRTLVFMTVFGEEKGDLGSGYYGRHAIFPIEKTIADVNLEQMGRTDSTEGPQIANASMTGFDYSDMGPIFQVAGALTGINVYKHARNSDSYFSRSDNAALARQGVPAHTLCVAFDYPDYHGRGDHWEKVDYDNMAKVDRMVALALVTIANSATEPKWNESLPQTASYVAAWKARHGK